MSDQDLLDIIETLKSLQIQQQQISQRQQDLTQQLDHILAGRGGDTANPHHASTVSPHTSNPSNPHRDGATSPVTNYQPHRYNLTTQHYTQYWPINTPTYFRSWRTSVQHYSFSYTRSIGSGRHRDSGASTTNRFSHAVRSRNLRESRQSMPINRTGDNIS